MIAIRTAEVRRLRDELIARQNALAAAASAKRSALGDVHATTQEMLDEAASLEETSASLGAQIRSSQSVSSSSAGSASASTASTASVSSSGFIWPVGGSVASGYGYRCLGGICRLHEGVDIGAGYGSPIVAAASGTVIYAGYMGGYGNLIVIDHGGGISTAYAHQSGFAVSGGSVSQGQTIGYVGCTGRCFGPHLHFEVRVNGGAVDPLGYL